MFQTERASELLRLRISKRSQFNMRNAFKSVDRDLNGAITMDDIRKMLAEHGFFATEKELVLIMNKFDKFAD